MKIFAWTIFLGVASTIVVAESIIITVNTTAPAFTVDERYVSFTFDASNFPNLQRPFRPGVWELNDTRTQKLCAGLGPAYLRVGGTHEDFQRYFEPGIAPRNNLTTASMRGLCAFSAGSGWPIVFGLNAQRGYNSSTTHAWDTADASTLIRFVRAHDCNVVGYELGNELNIGGYPHPSRTQAGKGFFTPALQADHFRALANLLRQEYGSVGKGTKDSPYLVGPDVTQQGVVQGHWKKSRGWYFGDFLGNFTSADYGVDRATYHHYFPRTSTAEELTTAPTLDSLKTVLEDALAAYQTQYRRHGAARAAAASQLWLGETGLELNAKIGPSHPVGPTHLDCGNHQVGIDCYFGGVVSYLDKLGLAARFGHAVVARQSITHLLPLNHSSGAQPTPVPGYWAAVLWKRLLGTRVLAVDGGLDDGRTLRSYAACGKDTGTVALVIINLGDAEDVSIDVGGGTSSSDAGGEASLYLLESYPVPSTWTGTGTSLNGVELVAADSGALPALKPKAVGAGAPVHVPARSVAFVTVPAPATSACGAAPHDASAATEAEAGDAVILNNRRPNLVPPAGTAYRGAELGAVDFSAAAYEKKYGVPLHVWRTFGGNVTSEMTAWVAGGGILWFNLPVKQLGTWRQLADGARDADLARWAASVAALAPAGVMVCPWHEPDHAVDPTLGMSTQDYRDMYRHVQSVFKAHGASNAVWVMDYSVQIFNHTAGNVMPLWPGDDAVDWLFFNVFEKGKKGRIKRGDDYTKLTTGIYAALLANSTNATSATCPRGCGFASVPWGVGAFGSHADVPAAGRVDFLKEAKAGLDALPRLMAYLYFDAKDSAIAPGAMQDAYEAFLKAPAFAANDAGAPPSADV